MKISIMDLSLEDKSGKSEKTDLLCWFQNYVMNKNGLWFLMVIKSKMGRFLNCGGVGCKGGGKKGHPSSYCFDVIEYNTPWEFSSMLKC